VSQNLNTFLYSRIAQNCIIIEHEWGAFVEDAFVEDDDIVKGDTMFFTYTWQLDSYIYMLKSSHMFT
jgi:hypothetical protein